LEITNPETFVAYFENIRARTNRVIAVIPPDRFDWRPDAGGFSFADLIRHLGAIERYMFGENIQGLPSRYPGHGADLADGPAAVVEFLGRMHAETLAILRRLTPEELQQPCMTPGQVALPRWKWLRAMIEHEVHHRGQIYLMLRMIGVSTPPLYGLTSEEVRANSEPLKPDGGRVT
jgi:uncharacterized damage-inducible protein DinB